MGRGGRLDAHRARVYLIFRLACEVAGSRRDLQAWAMLAHGASLAERRVVPSSNECKSTSLNGDIWMNFTPSRNQRFRDGDPVGAKTPIKTMAQAIATRSENE